ncbi:hypothetical protein WDW89_09820 [Deltaproteobacteria bacterium TL4]
MFEWFRKRSTSKGCLKGNYQHSTSRDDWNEVLEELYDQVIVRWKHGLAVISKTGEHGEISPNITFRIKGTLGLDLKSMIKQMSHSHFEKIFAMAQRQSPDISDCYGVKKLGLPNNCLVFLMEHAGDSNIKRAMLVFSGPVLKKDLEKQLEKVNIILSNAKHQADNRTDPFKNMKIPPKMNRTQMIGAPQNEVKLRLDYLESMSTLTPEQKQEQKELEEYLYHLFQKSMREKP